MAGQTPAPKTRTSRVPRWLRAVLPAVLIIVWFAIGGIGGPYFGKISQVSSNDATSYLPASSDATKVQNLEVKFAGKKVLPAVVLYVRAGGLDQRRSRLHHRADHADQDVLGDRERRLARDPVEGRQGRRDRRAGQGQHRPDHDGRRTCAASIAKDAPYGLAGTSRDRRARSRTSAAPSPVSTASCCWSRCSRCSSS